MKKKKSQCTLFLLGTPEQIGSIGKLFLPVVLVIFNATACQTYRQGASIKITTYKLFRIYNARISIAYVLCTHSYTQDNIYLYMYTSRSQPHLRIYGQCKTQMPYDCSRGIHLVRLLHIPTVSNLHSLFNVTGLFQYCGSVFNSS